MRIIVIIHLIFIKYTSSWTGILLDGGRGQTQIFAPEMHVTEHVEFGLPHHSGSAAAILNGRAYFIGGYQWRFRQTVLIFDPHTNTSVLGPPLLLPRYGHAVTTVNDNELIVCGS